MTQFAYLLVEKIFFIISRVQLFRLPLLNPNSLMEFYEPDLGTTH